MSSNFASEAGHWYAQDGTPVYELPTKAGDKLRPTTLRDARVLNLVPSVTTIMKEMAAPALEQWKIKQAVLAAKSVRRKKDESDDSYARRVMLKAQEYTQDRATEGSAIHGAIEQALCGQQRNTTYEQHVAGVLGILDQYGITEGYPEKSFAYKGYGGKVDFHNADWVIDFKTKEFSSDKLPTTYDQHFMQLGAYRVGLRIPKAKGMIVFVSTTHPGLVHPVVCAETDLQKGYDMFTLCRDLWIIKRGFFFDAE